MRSGNWRLHTASFMMILVSATILPVLLSANPVYPVNGPQFSLEGLTLSPQLKMTSGDLKGWAENDWVPFRLTLTNKDSATTVPTVTIQLEYLDNSLSNYGIDAFANCFSSTAADCGSGRFPVIGPSAVGSGNLWKTRFYDGTTESEQTPTTTFFTLPGGRQVIQLQFTSVNVPDGTPQTPGNLEITWAVHLALGSSSNLACSSGSPLLPCTPTSIPAGSGASSYPGSSLHVMNPEGNQTVPIKATDPLGHIVIGKVTVPSGDPQSFDFALKDGPSKLKQSFSLTDSQSHDSESVKSGSGYVASETVPADWDLTAISCTSTGAESTWTTDLTNAQVTITLAAGETVTCIFTDTKRTTSSTVSSSISTEYTTVSSTTSTSSTTSSSTTVTSSITSSTTSSTTSQRCGLIVIKHVIIDNAGTKVASDFTIVVTGNNPNPSTFQGAEAPGVEVALSPGHYSVEEVGDLFHYIKSLSADCSGTISPGETKTCIITNNDPQLIVYKHVINKNEGTKTAGDFTIHVTGDGSPLPVTFPGSEDGTTIILDQPSSYAVSEDPVEGYSASYSADCTGQVLEGQLKICIITNHDPPNGNKPPPVGGELASVSKLALLTPFLTLLGLVGVATVVFACRRRYAT